MRRLALLAITLFAFAARAQMPPSVIDIEMRGKVFGNRAKDAGEIRVLFIGNSLTYWNEMPWVLEEVAKSKKASPPLRATFNGGSGMTLKQHWDRGRALKAIREQRWNYVVLQGQSGDTDEMIAYASQFHDEIAKRGAKMLLFVTWPRQDELSRQPEITKRYETIARLTKARAIPIATAWHRLRAAGIEMYGDGLHPSLAGTYLIACMFYAAIYGKSPEGATHTFDVNFEIDEFYRRALETDRIDAATAQTIQRVAWETIR